MLRTSLRSIMRVYLHKFKLMLVFFFKMCLNSIVQKHTRSECFPLYGILFLEKVRRMVDLTKQVTRKEYLFYGTTESVHR